MSRGAVLALLVGGLIAVLVVLFVVLPGVQERLAPVPEAAYVGIEVADSGLAVVGPAKLEAGTPFRLHAILAARTQGGELVFFTEAPQIKIGGQTIAAPQVRRYDLGGYPRLLWFTIEGSVPYLALESAGSLQRFKLQEFFRPEWGRTWSVQGVLGSLNDAQLEAEGLEDEDRRFGLQRYQVWVEIFATESGLVAEQRYKSGGYDELLAAPESFATVEAQLPGGAAAASAVFGLTQIEPPPDAQQTVLEEISELAAKRLAFSRLTVLRDELEAAGRSAESLVWQRVDLSGATAWGASGVAPGDLLRVGARLVTLYRDEGSPGLLDGQDLCFDFEQGAEVRRLDSVFVGTGDVDWASLFSTKEPGS